MAEGFDVMTSESIKDTAEKVAGVVSVVTQQDKDSLIFKVERAIKDLDRILKTVNTLMNNPFIKPLIQPLIQKQVDGFYDILKIPRPIEKDGTVKKNAPVPNLDLGEILNNPRTKAMIDMATSLLGPQPEKKPEPEPEKGKKEAEA